MSSRTPAKIQSTSPMGEDGIIRCHHGEQVDRLVSRTAKNPNREFYACSRPQSERCGFWFWADDPIFTMPPPQTTPQVAAHPSTPSLHAPVHSNGLCTPRPSPLHSNVTFAAQSTPAKRKRPEDSATDTRAAQTSLSPMLKPTNTDTPNKRARLEAIEAGLRARLQDETTPRQPPRPQPTVQEQLDVLPFTHGIETNEGTPAPSPSSETATDVEQEVEPPRVRYSFLGLPPTQESESDAGPSTPKKRSSAVSDGQQDLHGHRGEASSSALLTPPRTAKTPANRIEAFTPTAGGSGSSRLEPVSPTRYKGKERASAEWDRLIETEENPFVDTTRTKPDTDPFQRTSRSRRSSLDSQGPSCTPTAAERISFTITGIRDTIHTLRTYADNFDHLDAVNYIERLERQKNALEFGEEAKKQHIAALSAERDQLKEKLRQLEERSRAKDKVIASLKARH